ncbi:MAG: ABC transporter permease subunit [Erysipelotrichia bacterium]|nr:ABC transporter permease subunit [Erysipelotrichia bacterium]
MKHKVILFLMIVFGWQVVAMMVGKKVIVPYPIDVLIQMVDMLVSFTFYETLMSTLSHVIFSVVISAIIAFILAYLSNQYKLVETYVSPILTILQTIPNISFIMIVLVWSSSLQSVYIVLTLVVFPLLYHSFLSGFKGIDQDLKDVSLLYAGNGYGKLWHIYLPLIKESILSGLLNSFALGIKVAVMAEILSGLPYGVGRAINYSRIQFDMTSVFAWTVWLIIIILFINGVVKKLVEKMNT